MDDQAPMPAMKCSPRTCHLGPPSQRAPPWCFERLSSPGHTSANIGQRNAKNPNPVRRAGAVVASVAGVVGAVSVRWETVSPPRVALRRTLARKFALRGRRSYCLGSSARSRVAMEAGPEQIDSRKGFRINEGYKGARSYGSVGEDEFEEAARIRAMFSGDIDSQRTSLTQKMAAARKRLLRRRLRRDQDDLDGRETGSRRGDAATEPSDDEKGDEAGVGLDGEEGDGGSDEASGSTNAEGAASSDAPLASSASSIGGSGSGSRPADGPASPSGGRTGGATVVGSSDGASFPGLGETMRLRSSRGSAGSVRARSSTCVSLGAAERLVLDADALSDAGRHAEAAVLLRHVRDFGVDRDVLQRRLTAKKADVLFNVVSLDLGLELKSANQLPEAWQALMEAAAEPRMTDPKRTVEVLTDVAMRLVKQFTRDPTRQVDVLQGAVDVETVHRKLLRDRRDELNISLALALQAAGRKDESQELLKELAKSASSSRRRKQAEWALMVQTADIGDEPLEQSKQFKSVWDENVVLPTTSIGGTAANAAAASRRGSAGGAFGGPKVGGLGPVAAGLATALLALPLLGVPLLVAWPKLSAGMP